jgi:NosR/NirI family nitrous oxide reductase transcriptional regulator
MSKLLRTLLPLVLVSVAAHVAAAQSLIPTPEFSQHQIPTLLPPEGHGPLREYLDVAALLVGLSLASLLALRWRSRRGLFLLAVVSLAWLGFWRKGCVCSIGAIQNVTLAAFDPSYAVPVAVIAFFALPLVFTLFFGRTFCAAVCPLGAIQELVAVRPIKVPAWLDQTLGLLAYVYLGLAVLFAAASTVDLPTRLICRYDPFVGLFRRSAGANMLILAGCFLLVGVFVGRPYCRFLCPYGAILGLLSKVSKWHVKIPPEECIQCRLCEEVCPYGAIREPTAPQSARQRAGGRRRLAALILLLPVLLGLGGWAGSRLAVPLSRLDPTVRLAERVRLEETGQVPDTTEASDAFRNTGRAAEDLYREARLRRQRFAYTGGSPADWLRLPLGRKLAAVGGGAWLGAWVGLVVGVKLIHLSVRRRRADYQPDRINCLSCGRCFWYCPGQQARWGLIQGVQPAKIPPG